MLEPTSASGRRASDIGLSLVELLLVVAVMGMLSLSIAGGIVVVLRNMGDTNERIADSVEAQNLVTWLPVDVSSAPSANTRTDPSLPSGCASASPGTNILLLSWTETINGTTSTFVANYRAVPVPGEPGVRLQRFTCSGAGSLGASQSRNVSNTLAALPGGWTPGQAPVAVSISGILITLTLTQADGDITRVESAQKNPAATLPPVPTTISTIAVSTTTAAPVATTTTTTTVVTPTTTPANTPTTTTMPATTTTVPCVVSSAAASPNSENTQSNPPNQLRSDVIVTIVWSGPCQLIQLQYDTGGSQGLMYQNFTTTSPFTVTLRGFRTGGTEIWSAGPHTLYVIDNNKNVLASTTLTVT